MSIREWIRVSIWGQPTIPVSHHVPAPPPPARVEPLSIVLQYKGEPMRVVMHDVFQYALWAGQQGMALDLKTPGDGSIRLLFQDETDRAMFKLTWSENVTRRRWE